ncbi:hypothetical protein [Pandoraea sp. NPDC090278]|uniref:hypothetical protein n=1 Tax=Pandoraea sp. NPDC090278 TaxID=3364391 RepID=UPI00383B2F20
MLLQTRGPKIGVCNICGGYGALTEDHTPPKGVVLVKQMELRHIASRLSAEPISHKFRQFQNGVKYRTLCAGCNNGLGAYDDPALIEFSVGVHEVMTSPWPISHRRLMPQKIMRSVLGHLCAQGVGRYGKGEITEVLARYLTDRRTTLPASLEVYWWPYPYRDQVLVRDAAYLDIRSGHSMTIWIMKFFPLAFLVVVNRPDEVTFLGCELSAHRDCVDGDVKEIMVDCRSLIHPHWPEAPTGESAILFGPEATFARERSVPVAAATQDSSE